MNHHFSLDPRTVLGVGPDASADEIHRAFLAKSKTYHPDHGGDEWAFKMVLRAYEILKVTRNLGTPPAARRQPAKAKGPAPGAPPGAAAAPLDEFRTIDAELVWIRYEGSPSRQTAGAGQSGAMTLSVCLVVSWPLAALVRRSVELPDAGEILRVVIQAFDHLRSGSGAIDSRSRIEDGQFVGWLSYPSVLHAESGLNALREELSLHELGVSLRTRDEQVPVDWLEH